MIWKALPPDIRIRDAATLFRDKGFITVSRFILDSMAEAPIRFGHGVYDAVLDHIGSSSEELGGLLIGHAYHLGYGTKHGYRFTTIIHKALPSVEFVSTGYSLIMGTELWSRASEWLNKGFHVVGWYHSHPSLGAFFSSRDRATQKAFFGHDYSLGVVIDPIRGERKCFAGPDAQEIELRWPSHDGTVAATDYCLGLFGIKII